MAGFFETLEVDRWLEIKYHAKAEQNSLVTDLYKSIIMQQRQQQHNITTRRTRKRRKHTKVLVTDLPQAPPHLPPQNIVKWFDIIHKVEQNYLLVFEVKVMQEKVHFISRYVHIFLTQWKIKWNHQHWKTPFFRWDPLPPSLPMQSSIQPGKEAITCCS